jgi:hypothetical protein
MVKNRNQLGDFFVMKKNAGETHQSQTAGRSGKMSRQAVCRDFQHEKKV